MGEISDLILEGDICQTCMCELGAGEGFPRFCNGCKPKPAKRKVGQLFALKYQCLTCHKLFNSEQGVVQHAQVLHGRGI